MSYVNEICLKADSGCYLDGTIVRQVVTLLPIALPKAGISHIAPGDDYPEDLEAGYRRLIIESKEKMEEDMARTVLTEFERACGFGVEVVFFNAEEEDF